ncbi:MAG: hypothetical protein IPM63_00280 [Acidobacteriota bacterium]|nr:MAG: hypothetical protein IPM63_00280 [Acidobacteriota bacterium]
MKFFEVAKRVVPFGIALVIGVLLALPFASAVSYDEPAEEYNYDAELRTENERLRHENCRMKRELRRLERPTLLDPELTVPEPPMPPVAPEAPLAPPPPPPPAAPVHRTDR